MRSQNIFYFFITDSSGRSAFWEDNIVKWQTVPRPLSFSPDGWQDTQPAFTRSAKYHGLNRQFTTPFKFVEDGAFILRYLLYTGKSYETTVYLNINKWNDLTDLYETYYKGEFDFIEIVDDSPTGISVNLIEGGFNKMLNASENTVYEFTPDRQIYLDAIELFSSVRYINSELEIENPFLNHTLPIIFLDNEGVSTGVIYQSQDYETTPAGYSSSSDNCFFETEFDITIILSGTIKVKLISCDGLNGISYRPGYQLSGSDLVTWFDDAVRFDIGEIEEFTINQTIVVPEGGKVFFVGRTFADNPGDSIDFTISWLETNITATFSTSAPSTFCNAFRPLDLLRAILLKITGNAAFTVTSSLLNEYQHLYITSGDAIRRITDAVIKTNFSDFFKSFDAILTTGFGISGITSVFEDRIYFYPTDSVTLDLDEISDLQISISVDILANTAKFGYANQSYEDLNGKKEFNTTAQWEFPVKKLNKSYEQISPYRADSYGIEYTRINLEGKTTTDSTSDNDVFIINVVENDTDELLEQPMSWVLATHIMKIFSGAVYLSLFEEKMHFILRNAVELFEQNYTIVSVAVNGADLDIVVNESPNAVTATFDADISFAATIRREDYTTLLPSTLPESVFNIEDLTPKRMLLKHGRWLRSMMYFYTLERLTFLTLDKNKDLSTTLDGNTITEKSNVRIDTLGTPIFYPYIFSFKTRVPETFISLFNDAVNGHVSFKYNGFQLYGFPVNMTVKPGLNEAQDWKLLASPLCDLSTLVDLLANPLNNINMATYGLSFSKLCPIQFVPEGITLPDVYNFRHMDTNNFEDQSTRYTDYKPYGQKWQTSDNIHLQCISRDLGPVQVDVINKHDRVFGSYPLSQVVTSTVSSPYQLFQGDINLSVFDSGCYRLRCTAGIGSTTVVFLSEWLNIAEIWSKTLLFQYTNTRNQAGTIFTTGYTPSFRIEGNIIDFVPRSRFSSYEDEPANQYLLEGVPYRQFTLFAGDSFGLPPWAIDKLNRIMTLNTVLIDGKQFVRTEGAQFESVNRINGVPGTWWRLEVREAFNLDNTGLTTEGIANESAVLINVDTMLFGDLTGQVSSNPIQIEVLNQ